MDREERLTALIEEHGRAFNCEVQWANLGRFALMEDDEGIANNGGPFWSTDDDWQRLLLDSATQERPDEWPASLLVDLDTGDEFECEVAYRIEVSPDPPAPPTLPFEIEVTG